MSTPQAENTDTTMDDTPMVTDPAVDALLPVLGGLNLAPEVPVPVPTITITEPDPISAARIYAACHGEAAWTMPSSPTPSSTSARTRPVGRGPRNDAHIRDAVETSIVNRRAERAARRRRHRRRQGQGQNLTPTQMMMALASGQFYTPQEVEMRREIVRHEMEMQMNRDAAGGGMPSDVRDLGEWMQMAVRRLGNGDRNGEGSGTPQIGAVVGAAGPSRQSKTNDENDPGMGMAEGKGKEKEVASVDDTMDTEFLEQVKGLSLETETHEEEIL